MFLVRFLPLAIRLLQGYAIGMTNLRLAWPRPLWRLLRMCDLVVAHAAAWTLALAIAIFTRRLRPTLRADESGRLPDPKAVWEHYLLRSTFVPSAGVTGLQGPFGNFVALMLYRRPARIERFDVPTDVGLTQRLSLRLLYAGNESLIRDDGSMESDISRYRGDRVSTGFSVCLKLLIDTHNAFVRELRRGWDPFPSLRNEAAESRSMTFARAAALNWHTFINFVEHEYARGYTGFQLPFIFKYFNTAGIRVLGFSRIRNFLGEKLRVGALAHLSYRPHWVLRNEISPRIPYAVGGLGAASCHQAVADLDEDEIASVFRELAREHGGAAVPRNIPGFLERASIDALATGRNLRLSYNDVLRSFRLPVATSFDRFRDGDVLRRLYEDVEDVEFPIGLIGDRLLTDREGGAEASYVMSVLLVLTVFLDELFGSPRGDADEWRDVAWSHERLLRHPTAKWEALFAGMNYGSVGEWMEWVYGRGPFRSHAAMKVSPEERARTKRGYERFRSNMQSLQLGFALCRATRRENARRRR